MRGRKPKPTDLHALHGTLNATRHKAREAEPKPAGSLLSEPPAWMTESQQAGWRYAVECAPRGLLKRIDQAVLAVWVEAENRHRVAAQAQARLDKNSNLPLLTKSKDGSIAASPYLGIMNSAATTMLKAGSELGFSPASRPRIPTEPEKNDAPTSPWAKLKVLNGGKA